MLATSPGEIRKVNDSSIEKDSTVVSCFHKPLMLILYFNSDVTWLSVDVAL